MRKASLVLLLGALFLAAFAQEPARIDISGSFTTDSLFLVSDTGMALYTFTQDTNGTSSCYNGCAEAWPPYLAETLPAAPTGIAQSLTLTERTDGTRQVAYDGMPLYFFASDTQPGDITGHEMGDVWYLAEVEALHIIENDTVGPYLVAPDGMALYIFTQDASGVSTCYDGCAEAWPPLTVESVDTLPAASVSISEKLSLVERTDGALQVAYDGMPLYFFASDTAPLDTTGQGVGDVWFVVEFPNAISLRNNPELGELITDSNGMTLYIFTEDGPGVSNCYDGCAEAWPPLTVEEGVLPVAHFGIPNVFDTIERTDGTNQVTYLDMPLYRFANDRAPGDATGQGAGDVWYVVPVN